MPEGFAPGQRRHFHLLRLCRGTFIVKDIAKEQPRIRQHNGRLLTAEPAGRSERADSYRHNRWQTRVKERKAGPEAERLRTHRAASRKKIGKRVPRAGPIGTSGGRTASAASGAAVCSNSSRPLPGGGTDIFRKIALSATHYSPLADLSSARAGVQLVLNRLANSGLFILQLHDSGSRQLRQTHFFEESHYGLGL